MIAATRLLWSAGAWWTVCSDARGIGLVRLAVAWRVATGRHHDDLATFAASAATGRGAVR